MLFTLGSVALVLSIGLVLYESGAYILLLALLLIMMVGMFKDVFDRLLERVKLMLKGDAYRVQRSATLAQSMQQYIEQQLDTHVALSGIEDTGDYLRIVLEIGSDPYNAVTETAVIPHEQLSNERYWEQMAQGIVNVHRPAPEAEA